MRLTDEISMLRQQYKSPKKLLDLDSMETLNESEVWNSKSIIESSQVVEKEK